MPGVSQGGYRRLRPISPLATSAKDAWNRLCHGAQIDATPGGVPGYVQSAGVSNPLDGATPGGSRLHKRPLAGLAIVHDVTEKLEYL